MLAHTKTQVENTALANSRFVFDRVLFLDVNFHQLKLTRGSSYLRLPGWISSKKAVVDPQNVEDEERFKWAILAALHHESIDSHQERMSNLRGFESSYDWRGLEFPIALDKIDIFEQRKTFLLNVLTIEGGKKKIYIFRKAKFDVQSRTTNLLLIANDEKKQREFCAALPGDGHVFRGWEM